MLPDDITTRRGVPDPFEAAEQLTALLDLASVGVDVRGARIIGRGSRARVQVHLSNGEMLEFEELRDMIRPQALAAEVVAATGATPALKQPQCVRAAALVRALAEHALTATEDDDATAWGLEYLQAADVLDVDMTDQRQRWGAFKRLEQVNPYAAARENGTSLATGSVVLRHADGSLLVRTGWFREYVRAEQDHTISPRRIGTRMEAGGWTRRGGGGRVKATQPAGRETLVWTFYDVPDGWGQVNE